MTTKPKEVLSNNQPTTPSFTHTENPCSRNSPLHEFDLSFCFAFMLAPCSGKKKAYITLLIQGLPLCRKRSKGHRARSSAVDMLPCFLSVLYLPPPWKGFPEARKFNEGDAFLLTVGAFLLAVELFAYSPLRCLLETLRHCGQQSSNCK